LRAQLTTAKKRQALDQRVDLAALSALERRHLKDAFILVKRVQEGLRAVWRLDQLA
jgi:signal-transduction protein with cAMP-binding, CBS, and nucleotidyltransferase domain